jgi:hypothetical protein
MFAEDGSADLESVDSLGKGIDAVAGDEGFAEFAHGHENSRHFLRGLLRSSMLLGFRRI